MKKKELTPEETKAALRERFQKLLDAANKQNPPPGAVKAFQGVVDECRRAGHLFWQEKRVRNPLEAVLSVVVDVEAPKIIGGGIPVLWNEQANDFLEGAGHAEASPIEKTLIEHAAVCWMRLAVMEIYYTAAHGATGNSLPWLAFTEKRLMLAQRRYARAVETLTRTRMMMAATRLLESRTEQRAGAGVHQLKAAS